MSARVVECVVKTACGCSGLMGVWLKSVACRRFASWVAVSDDRATLVHLGECFKGELVHL
jgi:hypothetical protein